MTERLALGITVGALNSVAVATSERIDDVEAGPAYGGTVLSRPSVPRAGKDAAAAFGTGAGPSDVASGDIVFEGFLDRVGDPIDMLAEDGSTRSAADLVAAAVTCLVDETISATTQTPDAVIACHPAWWSRHTVEVQRAALIAAELPGVTLVPEPTAAMRWLEITHGRLDEGAVVVYDLGATGLTISVMRTGEQSGPLGPPLRSTDIAGAEFDLLTMRYVLANARRGNDFDPFDPAVERELSDLRARCRNAKEALSINTAAVVPVRLDPAFPGGQQIRLVRDELEELLRGPLLASLDLMRDAVHRAGLDLADIGRVLLTGGGGSIPLVAELISTEFGLPVVAAPEPAQTSARGAAALAADLIDTDLIDTELIDTDLIDAHLLDTHLLDTEVATTPRLLVTDEATDELPRTTRLAPPVTDVKADALPASSPAERMTARRRAAIVAGAALVIGLLGAGTVAIGTGLPSGPNPPASPQQPAATGEQASSGTPSSPDGTATAQPAADPATAGPPQPNTAAGRPGSPASTAPGSSAVAVVNGQNVPTHAVTGEPAPAASPENGAPQQQPSPQPPAPQPPAPQQQPPPQPAPQPQPATQTPAPNPQPAPKPQAPSLPTGALSDAIDGAGGAVGTILQAPGEILGGNGG
ncbi:Hsp70 family protein [Nocardia sp. NPDC005366]|uniref:Hsp70 family protein n=1 Tax=Nocardia sp. NPDC005366 TaxID=3156878 RepID=UPI0033A19DA1